MEFLFSAQAGKGGGAATTYDGAGGVELALNPEEVDLMDTDAMQASTADKILHQTMWLMN